MHKIARNNWPLYLVFQSTIGRGSANINIEYTWSIIKEMTGNYKNYKIIFLSASHYKVFKIGLDWSSEFD